MDLAIKRLNKKLLPLLFITAYRSEAEVISRIEPFKLISREKQFQLFQRKPQPVFLLITGPGNQQHFSSLQRWLKETAPALLINFGICGGLDTSLPQFQNYLVTRIKYSEESEILLESLYPHLFERLLLYFPAGSLLTSEHPVEQEGLRNQLYQQTSCQLLDMEGYKLARIAISNSLPIILLKQLTDFCDKASSLSFRENLITWQDSLQKGIINLVEAINKSF